MLLKKRLEHLNYYFRIIERFDFLYKVIGLDLDNTLTKIDTTLDIISRELSTTRININDVVDYNLFSSFMLPSENEEKFWFENEQEIIRNSILSQERYEGILNNFSNNNTIFHIITSRHPMHKFDTMDWLKKNNIPYDKLIMTAGAPKVEYIEGLGIELMADDAPQVIKDIYQKRLNEKVDVLKVEYQYNKELPSKYVMDLNGNVLTK